MVTIYFKNTGFVKNLIKSYSTIFVSFHCTVLISNFAAFGRIHQGLRRPVVEELFSIVQYVFLRYNVVSLLSQCPFWYDTFFSSNRSDIYTPGTSCIWGQAILIRSLLHW